MEYKKIIKKLIRKELCKLFEEVTPDERHLIPLVIKDVTKEFTEENTCTIQEINSGLCVEFAEEVITRMGGYADDLFELTTDMFYSDFPEDVEDWENTITTVDGGIWSKYMLELYGYPPIDIKKFHIGHHQWVFYKGKHYDSESPNGEDSPWKLKFFQRTLKKEKKHFGLVKEEDLLDSQSEKMIIRKFEEKDKDQVMQIMIEAFSHVMPPAAIVQYTNAVTNFKKSIVVAKGDEIVGVYLFGNRQLSTGITDEKPSKVLVDIEEYNRKTGMEGVALAVKKEYQGTGIGSKLKDYTKTLDVDYVWGLQLKGLGNLQQWLKRRKLAAETSGMYITVEDLK